MISNAFIVVKEIISVSGTNNASKRDKKLTFNKNVPFRSCISKVNNTVIDNAENLDIVIPMYNLLEYENVANNFSINNNKTTSLNSLGIRQK